MLQPEVLEEFELLANVAKRDGEGEGDAKQGHAGPPPTASSGTRVV